jgi:hypothetical protein
MHTDLRNELDALADKLQVAMQSNNLLEDLLRRWLKRELPLPYTKGRCTCVTCKELRTLVSESEAVLTVPVTEVG